MIAWLAAQLASVSGKESASSTGALQGSPRSRFGTLLIWLIAIGMFLLVLWRLLEAALGDEDEEGPGGLESGSPRSARP